MKALLSSAIQDLPPGRGNNGAGRSHGERESVRGDILLISYQPPCRVGPTKDENI